MTPNQSETNATLASSQSGTRFMPVLAAAILGIGLLFAAGFANSEILHNAAHDSRHAASFPCH